MTFLEKLESLKGTGQGQLTTPPPSPSEQAYREVERDDGQIVLINTKTGREVIDAEVVHVRPDDSDDQAS